MKVELYMDLSTDMIHENIKALNRTEYSALYATNSPTSQVVSGQTRIKIIADIPDRFFNSIVSDTCVSTTQVVEERDNEGNLK